MFPRYRQTAEVNVAARLPLDIDDEDDDSVISASTQNTEQAEKVLLRWSHSVLWSRSYISRLRVQSFVQRKLVLSQLNEKYKIFLRIFELLLTKEKLLAAPQHLMSVVRHRIYIFSLRIQLLYCLDKLCGSGLIVSGFGSTKFDESGSRSIKLPN